MVNGMRMRQLFGIAPHWRSRDHVRRKSRIAAIRITDDAVWATLEKGAAMDIRMAGVARALSPGAMLEFAL